MADKWTKLQRSVAGILADYALPGESLALSPTLSSPSAPPPATPPAGPPAAAPGGQVKTQKTPIPEWDGKDFLALPKPESLSFPLPAGGKTDVQARTPQEMTEDEAKKFQLLPTFKFANQRKVVMAGYKLPWIARLDPAKDPKHAELIRVIKEVRERVEKVPVVSLPLSPMPADAGGGIENLPDPGTGAAGASPPNPKITLHYFNEFQLVFTADFNGTRHDLTELAEYTSDDPTVAAVQPTQIQGTNKKRNNGIILSKNKEGTTTVTATYKTLVRKVDVTVTKEMRTPDKKPIKIDKTTATELRQRLGVLKWTQYSADRPDLKGWIYDDDPKEAGPATVGMFDKWCEAAGDSRARQWEVASILRKMKQEGTSSSVNTYDGMILTLGSGNAGDGALMVVGNAAKQSPDVRRFLYMCGFAIEMQAPFIPPGGKAGLPRYVLKFVDLSEEDHPRVVYTDLDFHHYGWATEIVQKKENLIEVRPPDGVPGSLAFPDPKYDPNKKGMRTYNSSGPNPIAMLKMLTPPATEWQSMDDSYGVSKNNIEFIHALISLRKSTQPNTSSVFFGIDWAKSVSHTGHGIPMYDPAKTPTGTLNIGLRAAFLYAGMVAHNWGFGKKVATFVDTYLAPEEAKRVKTGDPTDVTRHAMLAKACARAVAVTQEKLRVEAIIGRWLTRFIQTKKTEPIDYETVAKLKGDGWWGYARVKHYWDEMVTGDSTKGEGFVPMLTTLKAIMKNTGNLDTLLTQHAPLTESTLDDTIKKDAGFVAIGPADDVWKDGFSMKVTLVTGPFDGSKFYAKDYADGTGISAANPHGTGNADPSVGYNGDGTGYFCVGPKRWLPGLPAIARVFDRSFQLVGVDNSGSAAYAVWKITKPGDPAEGKYVMTDHVGSFVDKSRAASSQPVIFDVAPWPPPPAPPP